MEKRPVVSHQDWIAARTSLLEKEKEFTRERDRLSEQRRALPWERVEKDSLFNTLDGHQSLSDLFDMRSQLIVVHFMFHPDWEAGCKSCSFLADNYNGMIAHLNNRDATLVVVSRAELKKLEKFKRRMGWQFNWVSSSESEFNFDFNVSFTPEQLDTGQVEYNYQMTAFPAPEAPGVSIFHKDSAGEIFHTYSCFARGLDLLIGTYNFLDLVPKGRNEDGLSYTMEWVRLQDEY